jgi:starch synthase (maltosyl-transferring)
LKATPGLGNVVLTVVSLDPFNPQTAYLEPPLWRFAERGAEVAAHAGAVHAGAVQAGATQLTAEDLLTDSRDTWRGAARAVTLSPDQPYRVWRLSLHG